MMAIGDALFGSGSRSGLGRRCADGVYHAIRHPSVQRSGKALVPARPIIQSWVLSSPMYMCTAQTAAWTLCRNRPARLCEIALVLSLLCGHASMAMAASASAQLRVVSRGEAPACGGGAGRRSVQRRPWRAPPHGRSLPPLPPPIRSPPASPPSQTQRAHHRPDTRSARPAATAAPMSARRRVLPPS